MSMLNFQQVNKIPCMLSWPEILKRRFDIHSEYQKKHQQEFDIDFSYVGNLKQDFNNLLEIETSSSGFKSNDGRFNSLKSKRFKINDPVLQNISESIGIKDFIASLQNLEANNLVGAHWDSPTELIDETQTKKTLTEYYYFLKEKHRNFNEISIDNLFNTIIIFLEPWAQGQAFMIGRHTFTNWKPGDVISFPWYMLHSTVNASPKNRHIIYMAGSVI